jgi:hypothetical protein
LQTFQRSIFDTKFILCYKAYHKREIIKIIERHNSEQEEIAMKRRSFKNILLILSLFIFLLISFSSLRGEEENRLDQMIGRIIKQKKLEGEKAEYFKKLTPLFFDYLKTRAPEEKIEPLYGAQSTRELGQFIEMHLGKNVIEFGEGMFATFEEEAAKDEDIKEEWSHLSSEHFIFLTHPGSAAEAEIEFIKKSAEGAFSAILSSLDIEKELKRCLEILYIEFPEKKVVGQPLPAHRKIVVYLHQVRNEESSKAIKKNSMGSMNFGATILEAGEEKGQGRLTAKIDVLYFNAFSLLVLHHEIAHAVLFLGSFNPEELMEKPLGGESDLRKAFFAGYRPIPPFLHEGIGDYIIYYHGFYNLWPLLPEPESLVQRFLAQPTYIPLEKLIKEDRAFSLQHHKEYSLEAASFLNYLIQTYGKLNLKKWFLTAEKNIALAFEKIYGISVKEMEKKWQEKLNF